MESASLIAVESTGQNQRVLIAQRWKSRSWGETVWVGHFQLSSPSFHTGKGTDRIGIPS